MSQIGLGLNEEQSWKNSIWGCIDVETTGFRNRDKIVSVGAVLMQSGKVLKKFHCIVNPGFFIPADAMAKHHITNEMVQGAAKIGDVMWDFVEFLKPAVMIPGYNVGFDHRFLSREMGRAWISLTERVPLFDVLKVVNDIRGPSKFKGQNTLESTIVHIGKKHLFETLQAHSAVDDSVLCGEVLWHYAGKLNADLWSHSYKETGKRGR